MVSFNWKMSPPTSIKLFFAPVEVGLHLKLLDLQCNIEFVVSGRTIKLDIFIGIALVRTVQINVPIHELVSCSVYKIRT